MPKRTDIRSIMIIGAGPIVIGQACEFDYSGVQACKALREEGYRVVLVNSNPATIMTDPEMADATYIEPITPEIVAKIIEKERPDALLPTMGGQTGLNTALALDDMGVLAKYDVELIGAKREAIEKAEDRKLFREAMDAHRPREPQGHHRHHHRGGAGRHRARRPARDHPPRLHPRRHRRRHRLQPRGLRAHLQDRPRRLARSARSSSTRALLGWKEFEMEVVRDKADNCIIVCSIENIDPMGVHTGDSHHRRPGADADRQGIPDDAQRLDRGAARDRRRDRRLQRPVRRPARDRPPRRHRDEPARLPLLGARLQGHRLPDRQDRRQARRRLHARRARQRHHPGDPRLLRADHRLRRHQDPPLRLREVPRRRAPPHHRDEVGRRGHGHRPHLPRIRAEGALLAGDRPHRLRRDRHPRRRRPRRQGHRSSAPSRCRPPTACASPPRPCATASATTRSTPSPSTTPGSSPASARSSTRRPACARPASRASRTRSAA